MAKKTAIRQTFIPGYYLIHALGFLVPRCFLRWRLGCVLRSAEKRPDSGSIADRVEYYNKLQQITPLPSDSPRLCELKKGKSGSRYFIDARQYTRWFSGKLRWRYIFGDVTTVPPCPAIVKSRPLQPDNANSVLMKLNRVRHYVFVDDAVPFRAKKDRAVFRGQINYKPQRQLFMEKFFGHPMVDAGIIAPQPEYPAEWSRGFMTIPQQLGYKFVMAVEGIDVASNLKWIMSSNSVAVMPRPTCETWFMEGRLVPDYHYIEVQPDFSDLEDRLRHYIAHPEEAEAIARNANEYVAQFRDRRRERLISLLVLEKYFRMTGQRGG